MTDNIARIDTIEEYTQELESVKGDIQENEREVLHRLCSDESASDAACLLFKMKECTELKDDTWRLLFTAIRDGVTCPISRDKKVPIVIGGQARLMTLQEIEEKLTYLLADLKQ